jgi:hypothetical protein
MRTGDGIEVRGVDEVDPRANNVPERRAGFF